MSEHKLFVGNMAARITQRDLWRFFSSFGPIDECAKFHESYAFVRFVNAEDARRARQQTHGSILKGRQLKVEFAATNQKTNNSRTKFFYVQPIRRNVGDRMPTDQDFLRLAGIGISEDEENFISKTADSRFFPRTTTDFNFNIDRNEFDVSRMRLFSDVSSGFGDDSTLFVD